MPLLTNPSWLVQQRGPFPWPTQQTTGYRNAPGYPGSLTNGAAVTVQSNTTYRYMQNLGVNTGGIGTASVPVTNVTCIGCQWNNDGGVNQGALLLYGDGITLSYCSFEPTGIIEPGPAGGVTLAQSYQLGIAYNGAFSTFAGALNVDSCDIWGFGNAIIGGGGTQAKPHVFTNNFIHDACQDATYHTDGIGCPASGSESYTIINNNNIQSVGNTQALSFQNTPGPSTWSNFTITNNLFGGFGFCVNVSSGTGGVESASPNIVFTDNTFDTTLLCAFGPLYDTTAFLSSPGSVWLRNKWRVPPGAYWGHQQYNGYYWMPVSISNASPTLDELGAGLVSLTDF